MRSPDKAESSFCFRRRAKKITHHSSDGQCDIDSRRIALIDSRSNYARWRPAKQRPGLCLPTAVRVRWLLELTYGESAAPDGQPAQVAHFNPERQLEEDVLGVVAAERGRLPIWAGKRALSRDFNHSREV